MSVIAITLIVVLMLVLVITNFFSKSRNTSDFYHSPFEGAQDKYSGSSSHEYTHSHDGGDWGSRDMSHHHAGHDSGFDGGANSGGDAGGAEGGGGGE